MIAWNSNQPRARVLRPDPQKSGLGEAAASQDGSDHHGIRDRLGRARTRDGHADAKIASAGEGRATAKERGKGENFA